jgi:hypothetical protein
MPFCDSRQLRFKLQCHQFELFISIRLWIAKELHISLNLNSIRGYRSWHRYENLDQIETMVVWNNGDLLAFAQQTPIHQWNQHFNECRLISRNKLRKILRLSHNFLQSTDIIRTIHRWAKGSQWHWFQCWFRSFANSMKESRGLKVVGPERGSEWRNSELRAG